MNAVVINRIITRVAGWHPAQMSMMVPAPTARGEEPKRPARKRQTASVPRFWAKPAPILKRRAIGVMTRYMKRRPKTSLNDAAIMGPKASP
jgi:hypothetical protein